jgi:hypothetical protein
MQSCILYNGQYCACTPKHIISVCRTILPCDAGAPDGGLEVPLLPAHLQLQRQLPAFRQGVPGYWAAHA